MSPQIFHIFILKLSNLGSFKTFDFFCGGGVGGERGTRKYFGKFLHVICGAVAADLMLYERYSNLQMIA